MEVEQRRTSTASANSRVFAPKKANRASAENDGTSFSYSAISGKSAISCGENRAEISYYGDNIQLRKIATIEEQERALWEAEYRQENYRFKKREKIGGFSRRSRRRMMEQIYSVGLRYPPLLVTLTYRKPTSAKSAKYDLTQFRKYLIRKWEAAGFWKLELQRNAHKNVHFHLILWGKCAYLRDYDDFRAMEHDFKQKWCKITGDGGEDRMRFGCHVEQANSTVAAKNYAIGHALKKNQEATDHGRHWGCFNKKALKMGEAIEKEKLPDRAVILLRRIQSKLICKRSGKKYSRNYTPPKRTMLVLDRMHQRKLMEWVRQEAQERMLRDQREAQERLERDKREAAAYRKEFMKQDWVWTDLQSARGSKDGKSHETKERVDARISVSMFTARG